MPDLALAANLAYHDARFTRFTTVDDSGNPVNVDGNELTLSPRILASAGLLTRRPRVSTPRSSPPMSAIAG